MDNQVILRKLLCERLQYEPDQADALAGDLCALSPSLRPLLERWISGEDIHDQTEYHGYSLDGLHTPEGMNVIAALLTLDWIIKDPAQAVSAIQRGVL